MYIKLYNQILDSSLAENRKLRHFFTDLLLCSDADGNVVMTNSAIALRIRADESEVAWGLLELQKPDLKSLNPDHKGKRIAPLDGHGYGWKILNYEIYRDLKTARQMREATADRVRRYRERQKQSKPHRKNGPLPGEARALAAAARGDQSGAEAIAAEGLPGPVVKAEAEEISLGPRGEEAPE